MMYKNRMFMGVAMAASIYGAMGWQTTLAQEQIVTVPLPVTGEADVSSVRQSVEVPTSSKREPDSMSRAAPTLADLVDDYKWRKATSQELWGKPQ